MVAEEGVPALPSTSRTETPEAPGRSLITSKKRKSVEMESGLILLMQQAYDGNQEEINSEENAYDEIQNACGSIFSVDRVDLLRICAVRGMPTISESRSLEWRRGDACRQDGPPAARWCGTRFHWQQFICQTSRLLFTTIWRPGSGFAEAPPASS
jgi:hypothetical protein